METQLDKLKEKFPFLTYGKYLEKEYLGIIQNSDNHLVSLYTYNSIPNEKLRQFFLNCGEIWWWESNRQIPINLFMRKKFEVFRPFLKTFIRKDFTIIFGPTVSLQEIITKRIKRRTIQLVKKSD